MYICIHAYLSLCYKLESSRKKGSRAYLLLHHANLVGDGSLVLRRDAGVEGPKSWQGSMANRVNTDLYVKKKRHKREDFSQKHFLP